jgi:glycosyltransferase involved in cell wall biosynthesis
LAKAISIANKKYRALRVLFLGIFIDQKTQLIKYMRECALDLNMIDFHERVPHKEISSILQKAKISMVSISYEDDGLLYTSPLKLYEYLASGLMVIAPRTPPILSAIPETLIRWALTDDPQSCANAIDQALNVVDDNRRERIEFAKKFTWDERAKRLVSFLNDSLQIHK